MVDISLQAVDGDSLPKDLFLSLRVGEQQKFSKANCSRTYKFPSSADRRYGKLELYRRVGVSSVSLDGESFQGAHEMAIQVEDERIPNKEVKYRFCLGGSASLPSPTNEAAQAQPEPAKQTSTKETKVVQAREYLQQHQLEQRLSEAMQAVLRERPEDPAAFIAQKLQSKAGVLKKVEEPVSTTVPEPPKQEPKAKAAAPQSTPSAPAPVDSVPPAKATAPASTPAPAAPVPAPAPAEPKAAKAPVEAPKAQVKEAAPAPTPKPAAPAAPAAPPARPVQAVPVATKPLAQPEVHVNLAMPSLADYPLPDNNFADPISSATLMIGDGMCGFANIGRPAVMIL